MKFTKFFAGDVRPYRYGVYQRDTGNGTLHFNKYDKGIWYEGSASSVFDASQATRMSGVQTEFRWRGTTKATIKRMQRSLNQICPRCGYAIHTSLETK